MILLEFGEILSLHSVRLRQSERHQHPALVAPQSPLRALGWPTIVEAQIVLKPASLLDGRVAGSIRV